MCVCWFCLSTPRPSSSIDGRHPIRELTGANVLTPSLFTDGIDDERFSRTASGATQSCFSDSLGSTIRLSDRPGSKVVDYTYEAYGKAAIGKERRGHLVDSFIGRL